MLRNETGHIAILHFALLAAIFVIATIIIAHVVTQTNLAGTITNLFDKAAKIMPHR